LEGIGFTRRVSVQQPIKHDFLKDVVFVDTPGYNKEDGESKKDKQIAINAVKTGEVLFWLIDIEHGTVKKEDFDFIKDNFEKEKPKVIIFNKADKKTPEEISKIILDVEIILKAKTDDTIIDIIAYSSHDRQILKSYRDNKDWRSIFDKVKSKARKKKAEQDFMESLKENLEEITKQIESEKEELGEAIMECNRLIVEKNNEEDFDISEFKNVINYYYEHSKFLSDLCVDFGKIALSSLNRELQWTDKVGFFENGKTLLNKRESDADRYNNLIKTEIGVPDIEESIIKRIDAIESYMKDRFKKDEVEGQKELRKNYRKERDDLKYNLKKFNEIVRLIEMQLRKSIKGLNDKKSENNFENLPIVGFVNAKGDIFNCIKNNDFDGFLDCLSKKTEISNLKNKEGHDILSLAVINKRYDMVSVLLPKAHRLIERKVNGNLSAREIAENNHDYVMVELLIKSSN